MHFNYNVPLFLLARLLISCPSEGNDQLGPLLESQAQPRERHRGAERAAVAHRDLRQSGSGHHLWEEEGNWGIPWVHGTLSIPLRHSGILQEDNDVTQYLTILNQSTYHPKDLSVSVISDRDQTELELTEDPKEKCLLNVSSFADVQEWKLHDGCTTWKDIKEESFNNSNKKHPSFGASCKVSRRPQFFIWNIFVIMVTFEGNS